MHPTRYTLQEWRALCTFYGQVCLACGESTILVPDHVVPTATGGSDTIANLQPLCVPCNAHKHTETVDYRTPAQVTAFLAALDAGLIGDLTLYEQQSARRFWARVDQSGGPDACWLWQNANKDRRYGAFNVYQRHIGAHRFAVEITSGPLLPGELVCHHCDTTLCCNPAHLYRGTATDNNRDTVRRGRRAKHIKVKPRAKRPNKPRVYRPRINLNPKPTPRGEKVNTAKLTEADVHAIRAAAATGESGPKIAKRYGLVRETVRLIILRQTWKHI